MAFNMVASPLGSIAFTATQWVSSPANTNFTLGTGNFTMECWFRSTNNTGVFAQILGFRGTLNGGFGAVCLINSSGNLVLYSSSAGASWDIANGTVVSAITLSTWYHVAAVRSGSSLIVYVNGAAALTVSLTAVPSAFTQTSQPLFIGGDNYLGGPSDVFTGQISNVRFVRGLAVYLGAFTVPTAPLTATQSASTNISAITTGQTAWLLQTPNDATWLGDSSIFGYTASTAGTTTASALTPFTAPQTTAFTATPTPLGSVSFNGTSQSLTVPSNAAFAYGTGVNFTIEMWIYVSAISGSANMYLFDGRPASTQGLYPTLYITQTTGTIVYYTNSVIRITSSSAVTINTWYHVALVRNSGTTTLYVNGTATGSTYADTNSYLASAQQIAASYNAGASLTAFYSGYISNLRVVNGVAVYTGSFIPPAAPLTGTQAANVNGISSAAVTGALTSLLLQTPNNASFITDSSLNNFTVTNNGSATASSLTPFSAANSSVWNGLSLGAASFNGSTQYLTVAANAAFNFSTGDFTMECWVNTSSLAATQQTIDMWSNASASYIVGQCQFSLLTTGAVSFAYATTVSATTALSTSASAVAINSWYHIAVVRSGSATGNLKIYVNGVLAATSAGAVTQNLGTTGAISIGRQTSDSTNKFVGYISNARIVNGIAVYTGAFTPPIQPLAVTQPAGTNISAITGAQTSLLLNTPNNITIVDNSTNGFAITNTGTVTTTSQTPFTTVTGPVAVSYTNPSLTQFGSWFFSSVSLGALDLTASTPQYSFGTGDFTIEFWMYMPGLVSSNQIMFSLFSNVSGSYITGQCEIYVSSGQGIGLTYATGLSTTAGVAGAASTISTSTWYHVALVRIGSGANNVTLYLNGAVTGQGQVTQALGTTGAGRVGLSANGSTANWFSGYITNLRVVKGLGVYTGVFTPPTSPLTVTQPSGANIAAITIPSQTTLLGTAPRGTGRQFNDFSVYSSVTSFNNTTGNVTLSALTPFTSTG